MTLYNQPFQQMLQKSKQPKTKAGLSKFRYGVTEKYTKGQAYDPSQCGWIVYEGKTDMNWQCSRKNGYGNHGLWCSNHATNA